MKYNEEKLLAFPIILYILLNKRVASKLINISYLRPEGKKIVLPISINNVNLIINIMRGVFNETEGVPYVKSGPGAFWYVTPVAAAGGEALRAVNQKY